jgi:hypothetical protein
MQSLDAAQDGLRRLAGQLLVGHGFHQRLEGRLAPVGPETARTGLADDSSQHLVGAAEMFNGVLVHHESG